MVLFNQIKQVGVLALTILLSLGYCSANEPADAPVYDVKFEDVVKEALKVSYDFKALVHELKSSEILQDKEKKYYYPTATLSTEMNEYYGSPEPDPDSTGEGILTISAKLWGTGVSDRIGASDKNRLSGVMNLKSKELGIYYTVLKYLTKIEMTRHFKQETNTIRVELEEYYQKQLNATKLGVSTQSDAMEIELTKSRFEEKVFAVVSNISKYFRDLRIETSLQFGSEKETDRIGIDYNRLINILEQGVSDFESEKMIAKNYDLRSSDYVLGATRLSAMAQRERFKVELINESHLAAYGGNDSFETGDTDDSYVGLVLTYDLFNHSLAADQKSSIALYRAEKERYDNDILKFMGRLDAKVEDYKNTAVKRNNLIEQLRISRELIENQKNEIFTDNVTYQDIADSLSSLNQSQISLLNMELTLYDLLFEIMELKSEKIY